MAPTITFLSDYGLGDEFVGVVHGVLAAGCPDARIIDIAHGVPRQHVIAGALMLARALPFMPAGVHLAVVDPGVGTERRAVALRCAREPWLLVGPDNGLLWPAAQAGGGVAEAVEISASPWRREPVSATFHGRDVFAPVAAHLAAGTPFGAAGEPLDPAELVRLDLPRARVEGTELVVHALAVDRYGNVTLDAEHAELTGTGLVLGRRAVVSVEGEEHDAQYAQAFADVDPGELLLYEDPSRTLALAVNRGSARDRLALRIDDELRIRVADG